MKLSHLLATTVFREIQNTTPSKSILTHYSVITTQSLASSLNQSFFCKIFSFIEVLFFRQSNWTWNIKLCMLQLWHGLLLEWVMKRGKNKCVDLIANFGMQNSKRNIICHYLLSLTAHGCALKLRTFYSGNKLTFSR